MEWKIFFSLYILYVCVVYLLVQTIREQDLMSLQDKNIDVSLALLFLKLCLILVYLNILMCCAFNHVPDGPGGPAFKQCCGECTSKAAV